MTLVTRRDSDGIEFTIWSQEQPGSCAVAAIGMARSMARQMTFDQSEWDLAWRMYNNAIVGGTWQMPSADPSVAPPGQTFNHRLYRDGTVSFAHTLTRSGFNADQVGTILLQEGFSVDIVSRAEGYLTIDLNRVSPIRPAIIEVGWYRPDDAGVSVRRSAHAIVAARKNSSADIVYLDPARGRLVERANDGRYGENGWIDGAIYLGRGA